MAKAPVKQETIDIKELRYGIVTIHVVGESPLYFNAMSAKAKRTLLLPEATGRKTAAERAQALKHEPVKEFRESANKDYKPDGPTRLVMPAPAFKGGMATAALDIPGAKKSSIGRLVSVLGYNVPIWGVPRLKMDVVRSADIAKTPDIRTRAFLREWATVVRIKYVEPNLTAQTLFHLLAAAGMLCGAGDFRQEKGKGSFGSYRLVSGADDEDWKRITSEGGRAAQDEALENPECEDGETEELLQWYETEVLNLGRASKLKVAA